MNDVMKDLLEALLNVARMAEDLKKPCGMDPESPQAIRNAQYMNISYAARAAITRAEAALSSSDDAPSRHPTDKDFRGLQMNDVTKDLLEGITDISKTYERFGATCVFEGQPMMYLSHLEEIAELAARAEASLSAPQSDALEQVRAEEREACAKACDELFPPPSEQMTVEWAAGTIACANAIRARGHK